MRKILVAIGPVFASFNAFGYLATWFTLGALGTWFREFWIPLTRRLWGRVVEVFPFEIILSIADKDSLTSIVFFLPLAIYALLFPIGAQDKSEGNLAGLIAFALAAVVAWQAFVDTWQVVLYPWLKLYYYVFLYFVLPFVGFSIAMLVFNWIRNRYWGKKRSDQKVQGTGDASTTQAPVSAVEDPTTDLFSLFFAVLVLVGLIWWNSEGLSSVRIIAPFVLILLVMLTTIRTPRRIISVGLTVLALVVSSYTFEAVMEVKRQAEDISHVQ